MIQEWETQYLPNAQLYRLAREVRSMCGANENQFWGYMENDKNPKIGAFRVAVRREYVSSIGLQRLIESCYQQEGFEVKQDSPRRITARKDREEYWIDISLNSSEVNVVIRESPFKSRCLERVN